MLLGDLRGGGFASLARGAQSELFTRPLRGVEDSLGDRDVKPLVSALRDRWRDGSDLVARILHRNVENFRNEILKLLIEWLFLNL